MMCSVLIIYNPSVAEREVEDAHVQHPGHELHSAHPGGSRASLRASLRNEVPAGRATGHRSGIPRLCQAVFMRNVYSTLMLSDRLAKQCCCLYQYY